jgi:hypothetical protein
MEETYFLYLILSKNWAGWLLLFSSFFIVMSLREVRKDRTVAFALCFILALHHFVAIANTFYFEWSSMHSVKDSYGYISRAVKAAEIGGFSEGAVVLSWNIPYINFLSVIFTKLGSSHFLAVELSVLAFTFSCIVFIKIANIINVRRYRAGLLILYGLLPATVLFTSVALREPYQILFLMLTVYFGLRIHIKPMKGARLLMILSVLGLGLFHDGLQVLLVIFVPMFLLFQHQKRSKNKLFTLSKRRLANGILVIVFIFVGYYYTSSLSLEESFGVISPNKDTKYYKELVEDRAYKLKAVPGRTNYDNRVDFSSGGSTVMTTWRVLSNYLFSPYPWKITEVVDIIPGFEALIRFLLIVFSIRSWCKSQGSQRRLYSILLLVWFLVTIIFAIGTANYGTAMRHNIVSCWLLILVGGSGLIKCVGKFILPTSKSEVCKHRIDQPLR